MASFTAAFTALKSYLAALEYSAGKPVFRKVYVTTEGADQGERYPLCRIKPTSMNPHEDYGDKMGVFRIELVIETNLVGTPMAEGQILGSNRATDSPTGAGLMQILDQLVGSIKLISPADTANLISWARMVGDTTFGGTTDKPQMTIPLEALLGKQ